MPFDLALVTGASSGIGEALCKLLVEKKIPLLITGRDPERLKSVQERLVEKGGRVQSILIDLADHRQRKKLIEEIHRLAPTLVINNAGFGLYGEALTRETAEQLEILKVNGEAPMELSLEAARTLISRGKKGIILNVSSAAAFYLFPQFSVYASTKAFLNHFSQSFDLEVSQHGIRVLTACPGMVETAFRERAGGRFLSKNETESLSPELVAKQIWQQIIDEQPLKIINWKYRLFTQLSRLLPAHWLAKKLAQSIQERIPQRKFIGI